MLYVQNVLTHSSFLRGPCSVLLAQELRGTQARVAFINEREQYFVLSEAGYRAKDVQDRYNREEEVCVRVSYASAGGSDAIPEQCLDDWF